MSYFQTFKFQTSFSLPNICFLYFIPSNFRIENDIFSNICIPNLCHPSKHLNSENYPSKYLNFDCYSSKHLKSKWYRFNHLNSECLPKNLILHEISPNINVRILYVILPKIGILRSSFHH